MAEFIDIVCLFFMLSGVAFWITMLGLCIYMWRNES